MSTEVRDLIAENEGKRRNGPASDGRGWYRSNAEREECYAIADAVLALFPDGPEVEEVMPFRGAAVHTCYVLRTAPEPKDDTDG